MAYDEALADRIREMIAAEPGLSEKRMFGGLAFLLDGRMSVVVAGGGGLLVRVEAAEQDELLAGPHTDPFVMNGREAQGWLRVRDEGLESDPELAAWVERGVNWAQDHPRE